MSDRTGSPQTAEDACYGLRATGHGMVLFQFQSSPRDPPRAYERRKRLARSPAFYRSSGPASGSPHRSYRSSPSTGIHLGSCRVLAEGLALTFPTEKPPVLKSRNRRHGRSGIRTVGGPGVRRGAPTVGSGRRRNRPHISLSLSGSAVGPGPVASVGRPASTRRNSAREAGGRLLHGQSSMRM